MMKLALLVVVLFNTLLKWNMVDGKTTKCQDNDCNLTNRFVWEWTGSKSTPISMEDANSACLSKYGTTLAIVDTIDKIEEAQRMAKNMAHENNLVSNCWIGLSYTGTTWFTTYNNGSWTWINGSSLNNNIGVAGAGWADGEPSTNSANYRELCVAIVGQKENKWNDVNCTGVVSMKDEWYISQYLCNNPDYDINTCICDCGNCYINGDPHIDNFDNLLWHYMGSCSYYYVTTCSNNNDLSLDSGIPFIISGEHEECFDAIKGRTCMKATYVRFYTSEQEPQLSAIVKLTDNYTATFVAEDGNYGIKNYQGVVPFDVNISIDTDDNGYRFKIHKHTYISALVLEGYFTRTKNEGYDYDFFDLQIEIASDYGHNGESAYVDIYLTECFKERTCGLCGVWDDNTINDFTYLDNNNNKVNTDGSIYSTINVSNLTDISENSWINMHKFGNEWFDDITSEIAGQTECNNSIPSMPNSNCISNAKICCKSLYSDSLNCDATFDKSTWVENCAFDACAFTGDSIGDGDDGETDCDTAEEIGAFDGANALLHKSCGDPSAVPTKRPTVKPTVNPTDKPTPNPTIHVESDAPSPAPSPGPTPAPTQSPTKHPTYSPTLGPTNSPSDIPSPSPTSSPTPSPTPSPSPSPSPGPTYSPSDSPTFSPTNNPTPMPSDSPSPSPTPSPTLEPSDGPSDSPTHHPVMDPTPSPSNGPTYGPTNVPFPSPSGHPTPRPTSRPTPRPSPVPTSSPTPAPTPSPIGRDPSYSPSKSPTYSPTRQPTLSPTRKPLNSPTHYPVMNPTHSPTNNPIPSPTKKPTPSPSHSPTFSPSRSPTDKPTNEPTFKPSEHPTSKPSDRPTLTPTKHPTLIPTRVPTLLPTREPTIPSEAPTREPTFKPTRRPCNCWMPTTDPTVAPTLEPSMPTSAPTNMTYYALVAPESEPILRPWIAATILGLLLTSCCICCLLCLCFCCFKDDDDDNKDNENENDRNKGRDEMELAMLDDNGKKITKTSSRQLFGKKKSAKMHEAIPDITSSEDDDDDDDDIGVAGGTGGGAAGGGGGGNDYNDYDENENDNNNGPVTVDMLGVDNNNNNNNNDNMERRRTRLSADTGGGKKGHAVTDAAAGDDEDAIDININVEDDSGGIQSAAVSVETETAKGSSQYTGMP